MCRLQNRVVVVSLSDESHTLPCVSVLSEDYSRLIEDPHTHTHTHLSAKPTATHSHPYETSTLKIQHVQTDFTFYEYHIVW